MGNPLRFRTSPLPTAGNDVDVEDNQKAFYDMETTYTKLFIGARIGSPECSFNWTGVLSMYMYVDVCTVQQFLSTFRP